MRRHGHGSGLHLLDETSGGKWQASFDTQLFMEKVRFCFNMCHGPACLGSTQQHGSNF
jgi:hypothetical protein